MEGAQPMINHVDAMNRLAEARVREELLEGRQRPAQYPAIMGTAERTRTRAQRPGHSRESATRTTRARHVPRASWLRCPRV